MYIFWSIPVPTHRLHGPHTKFIVHSKRIPQFVHYRYRYSRSTKIALLGTVPPVISLSDPRACTYICGILGGTWTCCSDSRNPTLQENFEVTTFPARVILARRLQNYPQWGTLGRYCFHFSCFSWLALRTTFLGELMGSVRQSLSTFCSM